MYLGKLVQTWLYEDECDVNLHHDAYMGAPFSIYKDMPDCFLDEMDDFHWSSENVNLDIYSGITIEKFEYERDGEINVLTT